MNNITIGLKSGKKIEVEGVDWNFLIENMNKAPKARFMRFNDIIFVTENI